MISSDVTIKYRYLFLIIVVNFILQSTLFQGLKINGVSANYTLVLVLIITIIFGIKEGLFTAIFAGLFADVFLSMAIGINLFILVVISILVSILGRPLFTGNKWILFFLTMISTILYHLMYGFFMYFLNKGVKFELVMIHVVPIEVIMNAILCVLVYNVLAHFLDRYKLD